MTRFARWACDGGFEDYEELWRWSVEDLERFWHAVWRYFDVQSDARPERVLGSREMPGAEWFPGTFVNYAEHVFRGKEDGALALQFAGESSPLDEWSWGRLRAETASIRE
ncbi:MAG: acetoacetyl-CoA synthetase, partial [Solirubrobacteraceae bacterium]|nr:acetoacetyl-CoA synthetase [Solirubrobacteraceae bacterium]